MVEGETDVGLGEACQAFVEPSFRVGDCVAQGSAQSLEAALRERVHALLSPTPVSRDELARAVGGRPSAVFAALVELALAGRAELLAGGMVCRA